MVDQTLLDLAGEGALHLLPEGTTECYRLTIRCSWGEHRVVRAECRDNEDVKQMNLPGAAVTTSRLGMHITFQEKDGGSITIQRYRHRLVASTLGAQGGIRSGERTLDELQWASLAALLRAAAFWELPPENGRAGMDGSTWVLEGLAKGRYHCVRRWSPHPEDDNEWFALPCIYLCDLAGNCSRANPERPFT